MSGIILVISTAGTSLPGLLPLMQALQDARGELHVVIADLAREDRQAPSPQFPETMHSFPMIASRLRLNRFIEDIDFSRLTREVVYEHRTRARQLAALAKSQRIRFNDRYRIALRSQPARKFLIRSRGGKM